MARKSKLTNKHIGEQRKLPPARQPSIDNHAMSALHPTQRDSDPSSKKPLKPKATLKEVGRKDIKKK